MTQDQASSNGISIKLLLDVDSTSAVEELMETLPIIDETAYVWNEENPANGWVKNKLHWIPVGRDRGNAGRIQLAGDPFNPSAERLVNGMEAIIELARRKELSQNPNASPPASPRDAAERYFAIPRLDSIPKILDKTHRSQVEERVRALRRMLQLHLNYQKTLRELSVTVRDYGIGQAPGRIHETLLSLGRTDKADKQYLIGVFGQGGSSTYAASRYSVVISRRSPDFLDGKPDGIGWTIVRKISPRGRRDPYYAYLAAQPSGRVPFISVDETNAAIFPSGTEFRHFGYDFGRQGSSVARSLYYTFNHVLFNPILPYDLYALKDKPDPMMGNAHRLARLASLSKTSLDKPFQSQTVS